MNTFLEPGVRALVNISWCLVNPSSRGATTQEEPAGITMVRFVHKLVYKLLHIYTYPLNIGMNVKNAPTSTFF